MMKLLMSALRSSSLIDLKTCITHEAFLGFVEHKSTTSKEIQTAIDEETLKLDLSYDFLCGQG